MTSLGRWLLLVACWLPASALAAKLAMPGFKLIDVEKQKGDFLGEYLAQKVVENGLPVTTQSEVAALIGFERQRQLLGCSDDASTCLAELAGGLGVDGLITGNLARVGSGYTVTVKVIAARDGRTLGAYSTRAPSEEALLDWMGETARTLSSQVKRVLGQSSAAIAVAPTYPLRKSWWMPAAGGGALLAGGLVFYGLARGIEGDLIARRFPSREEAAAAAGRGHAFQTTAFILIGAAGAAAGAAAGFYLLPSLPGASASVQPTPGGAVVVLGGALP